MSTTVIAESKLDAHADRSSSEATITAQVNASGYSLGALKRKHRNVKVLSINPEDLQEIGNNTFTISNSALLKYSKDLFGEGSTIESFISESPRFVFADILYKKVPVRKVCSLTYEPQYMATSPLKIQPDSVLVYGESAHLENIEYINTRHLDLKNLSSSSHGKLKLEVPNNKIRLNTSEVIYSLEVNRYVELSTEVKIGTKNVPLNQNLLVLPSKLKLTLRCAFPSNTKALENAKVFIDYEDFRNSLNGFCIPKVEGLPSGVYDYIIEPQTVECLAVMK